MKIFLAKETSSPVFIRHHFDPHLGIHLAYFGHFLASFTMISVGQANFHCDEVMAAFSVQQWRVVQLLNLC